MLWTECELVEEEPEEVEDRDSTSEKDSDEPLESEYWRCADWSAGEYGGDCG